MLARILVHVRPVEDAGLVVATPVDFPDLSLQAPSVEDALASLTGPVAERMAALEPLDRVSYTDTPPFELVRLPLEISPDKTDDPIELEIGLVVMCRKTRRGVVYVARAPILPHNFEIVARDASAIEKRAAKMLRGRLNGWSALNLIAADEPEDSRVVTLEVNVPDTPASGGEDGLAASRDLLFPAERLSRLDGREELLQRILATLSDTKRSSVMLVGPSGVGKTTVVHEIVARLAAGDVPTALLGRPVWRVPADELIAGARYTGMWQERVRELIARARAERPICAMEDPAAIVDAGRWSESDNNVSRYLRPSIESGELTIVCECTAERFAAVHRKEPSFMEAFHRFDVPEPGLDEAREIAAAGAARIAAATGTAFAPGAVAASVSLTARFEPYRGFPGKAVRLLEETARDSGESGRTVDASAVTSTFARRTGLPEALLLDEVPLSLSRVREHFETSVLDQPAATDAMTDLVAVVKAGLNHPDKPLGSFFFVGPTGVGKTELAKALAEFLFGSRDRVVRLDMGEYASGEAVQRLLGTSWNSEKEGELTGPVRAQPFSVVLLDELEKAHWSVFDALLAALGEGRLTDANGRTADFRNAIVIMTSNLGARRGAAPTLGFGAGGGRGERETLDRHYAEQAEAFFRPEFFNRIDRIVVFHPLSEETVRRIARRELEALLVREGIARRGLLVEVDDAVVDAIAAGGFHPRYGARPLQRQIERTVIQPLARLVVEKRPVPGQLIRVSQRDDGISVTVERIKVPRRKPAARERRPAADDGSIAKAEAAVADFRRRFETEDQGVRATALRAEVSALIERTHDPAFWDDADLARRTLMRIYRLERTLDRLDALRRRGDGLAELSRRIREERHRARLADVRSALAEMEESLLLTRLELAGASSTDGDTALLRVTPIGPGAEAWTLRLVAMYRAWAERTARECDTLPEGHGLVIEGLASLGLLRGESGIHRLAGPERGGVLARVTVSSGDDEPSVGDEDAGLVVRVYEEGRRRGVKDPRTGAHESHVAAVLEEGRIDSFLLAWLSRAS